MKRTYSIGLIGLLSILASVRGFPSGDMRTSFSRTTTRPGWPVWLGSPNIGRGVVDPLENAGITLHQGELIEGDILVTPGVQQREEPMAAAGSAYGGYGGSAYGGHSFGYGPDVPENDPARRAPPQVRVNLPDLTWRDRIVPYVIDDGFNATELTQIRLAIQELAESSGSCITFVPRDLQHNFIFITGQLDGCNSYVGRQGGNQTVSISSRHNCVTKGIIVHELMHVLGFLHEHTRRDRDSYIRINYGNIIPGKESDFSINKEAAMQNISYDYYSIMHYKTTQFSLQTQTLNTIDVLDPTVNVEEVGQRKYLSDKDLIRIKTLYNCPLKKCSYPHTMNDYVVQVKNTSVGSSIRYSCTSLSHVLIGAPERTCMYDGKWSGSIPICFNGSADVSYCNFESPGLCGWTQDTTDEADWTRQCAQTPSGGTGPIEDHTLQTPDGFYMYLEGTGLAEQYQARLLSTVYPAITDGCVLFWYNMHGTGMGSLTIYLKSEGDVLVEVKNISGNQGYGWKMGLVHNLSSLVPFQVVFEATRGNRDTTDIAIDDVIVGACPTIMSYKDAVIRESKEEIHKCDFDTEFCGWYQSPNATLTWYRHTGSTPTFFTGPSCDCNNCSACTNGSYVYIETSGSTTHGDPAQLISQPFKSVGYTCINFEYHMFGQDIGNLSLHVIEGNMTSLIWSASGNQSNKWLSKQLQLYSGNTFQLGFTATSGGSYRGDIAVDDITLHSGKCPVLFECDFDHRTLCDLYNGHSTDGFGWTFGGRLTSPTTTGPRVDHTSGQGMFLYIDASAPRLPGDTAELLTPPFIATGNCLTYWYYMYGRDVASLRTLIRSNNGTEAVLDEKRGNLGETWYKSTLNIPPTNTSIQIVFEGVVGSSYSSDIAIDDVSISNSKC